MQRYRPGPAPIRVCDPNRRKGTVTWPNTYDLAL
jgi:hypothetical protein